MDTQWCSGTSRASCRAARQHGRAPAACAARLTRLLPAGCSLTRGLMPAGAYTSRKQCFFLVRLPQVACAHAFLHTCSGVPGQPLPSPSNALCHVEQLTTLAPLPCIHQLVTANKRPRLQQDVAMLELAPTVADVFAADSATVDEYLAQIQEMTILTAIQVITG